MLTTYADMIRDKRPSFWPPEITAAVRTANLAVIRSGRASPGMSEAVAAAILENAEDIAGLRKTRTASVAAFVAKQNAVISEHQSNKALRYVRK